MPAKAKDGTQLHGTRLPDDSGFRSNPKIQRIQLVPFLDAVRGRELGTTRYADKYKT